VRLRMKGGGVDGNDEADIDDRGGVSRIGRRATQNVRRKV